MDNEHEDRGTERQNGHRTLLLSPRLVAAATGEVSFSVDDFVDFTLSDRFDQAEWSLREYGTPEVLARHTGSRFPYIWNRPGRFIISCVIGRKKVSKEIVVAVDPQHLVKNPTFYAPFFYCLVTTLASKVYFMPIRPGARRRDTTWARDRVLKDVDQGEPTYRQFVERQDDIYSCRILRRPRIEPDRFRTGVYAVFEQVVLYLGNSKGLDDSFEALREALAHDARVLDPDSADPAKVFTAIQDAVDAFDANKLEGLNADFVMAPFIDLPEGRWFAGNIGAAMQAFEGYLADLGLDPAETRTGCMFGFNADNATFSSRVSDAGLGISRHSTNTLGGPGMSWGLQPVSRLEMLSDGSEGGPPMYYDSGRGVYIVGASSPQEVTKINVAAYGDPEVEGGPPTVWVYVNNEYPSGPAPGDTPGSPDSDESTPDAGTADSPEADTSESPGDTTDTADTTTTPSGETGTSPPGDTSETPAGETADASPPSSPDDAPDAPPDTPGPPGGSVEMPGFDPETAGGSGGVQWVPTSEFPIRQRAGGYTDPDPNYDGSGYGRVGQLLGYLCPLVSELDPLINPGPDAFSESQFVGIGFYGENQLDVSAGDGVIGGPSDLIGSIGSLPGGYASWDEVCGTGPRVLQIVSDSVLIEMLAGQLAKMFGSWVDATGLFAFARTYTCSGESSPPSTDRSAQELSTIYATAHRRVAPGIPVARRRILDILRRSAEMVP